MNSIESSTNSSTFIKGKPISSQSPEQIQEYINHSKNSDERTLTPVNSNITQTFLASQELAGSDIYNVQMGMEVAIKSVPLTTYHLICPTKGRIYSHNLDEVVMENDFLIFAPHCFVDVTWENLSQAVVITLDPNSLKEYFKITPNFSDKGQERRLSSTSSDAVALASTVNYILSTCRDNPALMQSHNMQKNCESLLFEALALSMPELETAKEIQALPYHLKQALEYIEENIHQNITMNDLVRISGVSRRSFETIFSKVFQISPMKFITNKKLELVRNLLIISKPEEASVIEISERFGFQHASHFSMLYQRRYSEKPSETLRTRH